jgi:catechol 2,3-dioxygenase-like lactoylglutathione lyase family enzyme
MRRRDALTLLGAGAWTAGYVRAAQPVLDFSAVDHLEFFVSDIQRSLAFYTSIFGSSVLKNNRTPRRYLQLGSAFIAIEQGDPVRVDHICAGARGYQVASLHAKLAERDVPFRDYPSGRDLYVTDPDGARLQLGAEDSWKQLPASSETPASSKTREAQGEPVFKPLAIEHILMNVSDPEKSAAFYEKVFGPVVRRNNNRIWFQAGSSRVGLLKSSAGQRAGLNHFGVSAAPFDYAAVTNKLQQAGVKMETPEVVAAPEFRDPDGYLIQVMPPPNSNR